MCKYCEMKTTEISGRAGDILPEMYSGDNDKLCILDGNILSGRYDSRIKIKYCPMCGQKIAWEN